MGKKHINYPGEEEIAPVKFKPILGIQPAAYIGIFYLLLLLTVCFFLFLFPGIRNYGSMVTFHSVPEGASVHVDGIRVGFTPLTAFIPQGSRKVELLKPGFTTLSAEENIHGRRFGSLFFKKKQELSYNLTSGSPDRILENAYKDFATWILNGEPTATYRFPLFLSEGVTDYSLIMDSSEPAWKMLASAAAHVNSEGAMKDFVRAALLTGSRGRALTPMGLAQTAVFFSRIYSANELSPYWLSAVLPDTAAAEMTSAAAVSEYFDSYSDILKKGISRPKPQRPPLPVQRFGAAEYVHIPGGEYYIGWAGISDSSGPKDSLSPPHRVKVESFLISKTELTEEEYAEFLSVESEWSPRNKEELIRQGKVNSDYLISWKNGIEPPRPTYPVRGISYYAAKAYCEYLGRIHPGYIFDLPTEIQWEWAASLDSPADGTRNFSYKELKPSRAGESGSIGLRFMEGNVWEWCRDWYAPGSYIFGTQEGFSAAERIVRGGSFINPENSVTLSTRGSQPPDWCTPYLGFRVAAYRKE